MQTLTDENLRRRLLLESLSPPPVPALPWHERLALFLACILMGAFFAGLMWHLILFL